MKEAVILMGLQASGKSTFSREKFPDHALISLDVQRTRGRERELFSQTLLAGRSLVVDNTNPTVEDRQRYIVPARAAGYRVVGYFLQSRVAECIDRNALRAQDRRVPRLAILGTFKKLQMPSAKEGFDALFFVRMTETGFDVSQWKEGENA